MGDARSQDLAFEPVSGVEQTRRVGALARSTPTRRREPGERVPQGLEVFALKDVVSLPFSVEDMYRQWLFHGPLMAGIREIQGIGTNGIAGGLMPSMPQRCLGRQAQGAWVIDPVVLDSALQMIIVWTRMHWDMTPLPSRMHTDKRFGALSGERIDCRMRIENPQLKGPRRAEYCSPWVPAAIIFAPFSDWAAYSASDSGC
jgi:hypothetical protein